MDYMNYTDYTDYSDYTDSRDYTDYTVYKDYRIYSFGTRRSQKITFFHCRKSYFNACFTFFGYF